jgi:hypothetical protein
VLALVCPDGPDGVDCGKLLGLGRLRETHGGCCGAGLRVRAGKVRREPRSYSRLVESLLKKNKCRLLVERAGQKKRCQAAKKERNTLFFLENLIKLYKTFSFFH